MRIALDALAARFGGTAYMVAQIVAAMSQHEDVEHVWVLVSDGSVAERALVAHPRTTVVKVSSGARLQLVRRAAWEAAQLNRLVRRHSIDRLVTVSGMLPRHPPCAIVAHLTNPLAFERNDLGNRLRRALIRRTVRHCEAVVVPTGAMGRLVARGTGRRALAIPLGVDRQLFAPAEHPGRDILYVGDFYAHKRHDLAIDAWTRLRPPRPRLRFIGNPEVDPRNFQAVQAMAGEADPTGAQIVVDGRVPLSSLLDAYRQAAVFLMPSEHESFSMPLAEALACGVPAVVRDLPSLRETGAAGAVFVGADHPGEWAEQLEALLRDARAGERLRERARRHAERFSWDAVAAGLVRSCSRTEDSEASRVLVEDRVHVGDRAP